MKRRAEDDDDDSATSQGQGMSSARSSTSSYAPGLARRCVERHDRANFAAVPRYANPQSIQQSATWQTFMPPTGQIASGSSRDNAEHNGNNNGKVWIDEGIGEDRWVQDSDLLQQRPMDAFEFNNQDVLGLNVDYSNIRTPHGSVSIKTDDRAARVNPDGSYRDGGQHGRPKKRHMKELKRRIKERDNEKALWRDMFDEWLSLPEEVKEMKRAQARENVRLMMDQFQLRTVDQIPEDYEGGAFEMGELSKALDHDNTASEASSTRPGCAPPRDQDRSRRPVLDSSQSPRDLGRQHHLSGTQHRGRNSIHQSVDSLTPGVGSSLATPTTLALTYRPRTLASTAFRSLASPDSTRSDMSSRFEVIQHPDHIPFEDVGEINTTTVRDREARAERIMDLNSRKGRIVTVRLAEAVTLSFPEAVSERLFGGLVQEIQFFPATKHAVICFLTPISAAAFVRHINNTRHNSQHEYRRLQIAATWYGDNEQAAIFPGQEGIIRAVIYDDATRVLKISGIETSIQLADLNATIKQDISLGRLVVKGRFKKPTKVYEKTLPGPTKCLILEMASIRDAIEVKALINAAGWKEFPAARAEFYKDPVDAPAVMKSFCDCRYCIGQGSAARSGRS